MTAGAIILNILKAHSNNESPSTWNALAKTVQKAAELFDDANNDVDLWGVTETDTWDAFETLEGAIQTDTGITAAKSALDGLLA